MTDHLDPRAIKAAKHHAFTTTLICLRLQNAALVARGLATREVFEP